MQCCEREHTASTGMNLRQKIPIKEKQEDSVKHVIGSDK